MVVYGSGGRDGGGVEVVEVMAVVVCGGGDGFGGRHDGGYFD